WFEEYAFQDGQGIVSDERAAEEIPYQWQQAQDWKKLQTSLTQQKMLNAILDHRTEQELLSYWLKLEANIKTDIETQYEKAWKKWKLNEHEEATGNRAEILSDFLVHAGRYQDFTRRLKSVALKSAGHKTELYSKRKNAYANFLSTVGENDTALMLHRENLELRRSLYEDQSEKISETLGNLGICYGELNQHDRAIDFMEASLNNFKKTKVNYRDCITIEGNLAVAYYHNGDFQNAKRHAVSALSSAETLRLPDTQIAILLNNYALASSKEDKNLAIELYSKAIEISRRLLGDDHEITASSLLGLSGILKDLEKFEEALELVNKALSSFVRYMGQYNSATFEALNCKAIILTGMDRFEQAAICFEEAVNIAEHVYDQQDPEGLRAIGNAAVALNIAGRLEDSVNYFEKFVNNTCKSHPVPNIQVIEYLLGYLAVLRKLKETRTQIEIINEAFKLACECESYDFKELADLFHLLAINLEDINELDAAEAIYTKLLHVEELLPEIDQSLVAFRLANNLSLQQRYSNAEYYYRLTLAIEERDLGADHADIAITYYNLGKNLAKQAKYLDAEDYFQKTLAIELRELSDNDPDIALTFLWIGECQFHQAKFDDAEQNLLKALSLQLIQYSEYDAKLKRVLELLSDVSVALGKDAKAGGYASKLLSLDK
ncbi:tetratricopeptide repeat protein, partial [Planktomarina temperata]|nr:tetratricopeptide repeat protein [Planktomarina temperata]